MRKSYKIIRFYREGPKQETIKSGLTLQEVQEHCKREDTHKIDSQGTAIWFDGYDEE